MWIWFFRATALGFRGLHSYTEMLGRSPTQECWSEPSSLQSPPTTSQWGEMYSVGGVRSSTRIVLRCDSKATGASRDSGTHRNPTTTNIPGGRGCPLAPRPSSPDGSALQVWHRELISPNRTRTAQVQVIIHDAPPLAGPIDAFGAVAGLPAAPVHRRNLCAVPICCSIVYRKHAGRRRRRLSCPNQARLRWFRLGRTVRSGRCRNR